MKVQALVVIVAVLLFFSAPLGAFPLPSPLLDFKLSGAEAGTLSLADFKGKTVILVLAGRKSYDSANVQLRNLALAFADDDRVVTMMVADLPGVPGFVKGAVLKGLSEKHAEMNTSLAGGGKKTAKHLYTLYDWEGVYSRELGASGETNDTYHLAVIDRNRRVAELVQQKVNGVSETQIFNLAKAAVNKSLKN